MNIKRLGILFLTFLFILGISGAASSYAQTPTKRAVTTTPSPTDSDDQDRLDKIKKLRDLVATRVAEMTDKTSVSEFSFGILKEASRSSLLIETKNGTQTIGTSDDTLLEIDGEEDTSPNFATIDLGQMVVAEGTKQGNTFEALRIIVSTPISYLVGKIVNVDTKNGQITVTTAGGNTTVEIERTTFTNKYENSKIVKSGLSRLIVGERVHIAVEPAADNTNPTALRILALTSDTPAASPSPAVTQKITPSTTSTPRVTPRTTPTPTRVVRTPTPSI